MTQFLGKVYHTPQKDGHYGQVLWQLQASPSLESNLHLLWLLGGRRWAQLNASTSVTEYSCQQFLFIYQFHKDVSLMERS